MNQTIIAEKLLQTGAVVLRPHLPFTWASGWKSPIYCDNRKLLSFPYVRDYIKSELCNLIYEQYPDVQLLAGVATAGIAWGAMVADQLKLPFVYVRPKPKEHGMGNQIEGRYDKGWETVVIEDLISTGKSSLLVVEVLRREGLVIDSMTSLFSYHFPYADEHFAKAGVRYESLCDYNTLIEVAIRKGFVKSADEALLLQWRKSPETWTGDSE